MTDRWRDRLARVDQAVDRVMAEAVRIVPMRQGDFSSAAADPDRAALEVDALLTFWRGDTDLGGDATDLRNARITTERAELQVMKSKLPAGYQIRKDDRVVATDQGLVFKVERVDRRHPGRVALALSIVNEAAP